MGKKPRKTSVRFNPTKPMMTVLRSHSKVKRVVYILQADKAQQYKKGYSRIIYIGQSGKKGFGRPATSAYRKADQAFGARKAKDKLHGVTKIDVHLLTFRGKRSVRLWEELEKYLLAAFVVKYDSLPRFNHKGRGSNLKESKYFSPSRLKAVVDRLAY